MKTVVAAAGALLCAALLGTTGCAASSAASDPAAAARTAVAPAAAESQAQPTDAEGAPFGARQRLAGGLVVQVSEPRSITPSETAYPASKRAMAFEITIDNQGTDVYRADALTITATVGGRTAEQVVDSTQGYTGTGSIAPTLAPGRTEHVAIAFTAPRHPATVQVTVQPGDEADDTADASGIAEFSGTG